MREEAGGVSKAFVLEFGFNCRPRGGGVISLGSKAAGSSRSTGALASELGGPLKTCAKGMRVDIATSDYWK